MVHASPRIAVNFLKLGFSDFPDSSPEGFNFVGSTIKTLDFIVNTLWFEGHLQ